MIFGFLGPFVFFSFYSLWLSLSIAMALMGTFLPFKSRALRKETVKEADTICKILFEKKKLTAQEYAFETDQVAVHYDDLIFKGYGFIVFPVIYTLRITDLIDRPILFLVKRWMAVHHYFFDNESHKKPLRFDIFFTKFCVAVAKGTGKSLCLFL